MGLLDKGKKEKGGGGIVAWRAGGIFILILISACSIYSVGVQQGKNRQPDTVAKVQAESMAATTQTNHVSTTTSQEQQQFVLGIPQGEAVALPSIRISEEEEVRRKQYGGKGDKAHLGGFTKYDGQGVSPGVWRHMITDIGVKSLIDVGCGKGVSTLYFELHGVDTLCLEGSHDAVEHTLLSDPEKQIVEHDFSRGPYWPAKTYDAVWSVEFLEHVGRNFQYNYIQAFRKAAYIFVSHSKWGGWHHVEVHDGDWWITRMESFGFKYSATLTEKVRNNARKEKAFAFNQKNRDDLFALGPDGEPYNAQHVWLNMMVFINPVVASLPEHAHLLAELGCYKDRVNGEHIKRECDKNKGESELPESFKPLKLTTEMHQAWLDRVKQSIADADASNK